MVPAVVVAILLGASAPAPPSAPPGPPAAPTTTTPATATAAPTTTARPSGDPLGCAEALHDPAGLLDRARVERAVATTARRLDADVHVRVERSVDGDLEARMAQLVRDCPGWAVDGDRAGDLLVVMYSQVEREAAVFYGPDLGPVLEARWEPAVDAMIVQFRSNRFDDGVEDALRTLRTTTFAVPDIAVPTDEEDPAGGGSSGAAIALLVLLGLGLVAWAAVQHGNGGGSWAAGGDSTSSRWSSRSSRRRSFGSFGSRRRSSRSGGSSRRRSSGGARRSGGGSKKW